MSMIQNLAASTEVVLGESPFTIGRFASAYCAAASKKLYGVLSPGTNRLRMGVLDTTLAATEKILRIEGDGSAVAFDDADYEQLANAHVDSGTLSEADRLRVVVLEKNSQNQIIRILNRVAASDTPASGEFKTSGDTVLTVGAALSEGAYFEIWILDASDITTYSPTQYLELDIQIHDVMSADNALQIRAQRP